MAHTTHGHHIPGTPAEPWGRNKVRCGGPSLCPKCATESILSLHADVDHRLEDLIPPPKKEVVMTDNEVATIVFVRKPFFVTAALVTESNMQAVARWCKGEIRETERSRSKGLIKCIHVPVVRAVPDWQKQARVGDWVVRAGSGFRVYTDKAIRESFDVVAHETENLEGDLRGTQLVGLDCD